MKASRATVVVAACICLFCADYNDFTMDFDPVSMDADDLQEWIEETEQDLEEPDEPKSVKFFLPPELEEEFDYGD